MSKHIPTTRGKTISTTQIEQLRACFLGGETIDSAAAIAGVAHATASVKFKAFEAQGLVRPPVARKQLRWRDVPVYTGPDWIG